MATGAGMVGTVALRLLLVPQAGLVGAAIAFAAGSVLKLIVITGFTVRSLYLGATVRLGHLEGNELDRRVSTL